VHDRGGSRGISRTHARQPFKTPITTPCAHTSPASPTRDQHPGERRGARDELSLGRGTCPIGSAPPARMPDRLSASTFWALHQALSEPAGYFRSDNLVGNEVTMQHPIPELVATTPCGGVYLGVGPDQNFTYIAALQLRIAFVADIRRLNVMQHLYYKSLLELSETRADFLARPSLHAHLRADDVRCSRLLYRTLHGTAGWAKRASSRFQVAVAESG
jgi:hypothetical protein